MKTRSGILRLTLLAVALATLGLTPASATTGQRLITDSYKIEIPARLNPFISCKLTLFASFSGFQDTQTGNIYGTWIWSGNTSCNAGMDYLFVRADMFTNFGAQVTAPIGQCQGAPFNGVCTTVNSASSYYCPTCNGSWQFLSTHRLVFPVLFTPFLPNRVGVSCHFNHLPNDVTCMLNFTLRL